MGRAPPGINKGPFLAVVVCPTQAAVITFKLDSISPLPLIRVDGKWKLDFAAHISQIGDHLNDVEASVRQIMAIVNSATTAIAGDKYSDAAHLAKDLQSQIEKVQ